MDTPARSDCATCTTAASFTGNRCRMPAGCPTQTQPELTHDATRYRDAERMAVMRAADATPFTDAGTKRNRVEELVHYAKGRGYRRVGVAFCVSLTREAQALARMLEAGGLEAELVCCRVGSIDYSEIGLTKKHPERFAAICNPVAQAEVLNQKQVDLVADVGLCIGHDLLLQEVSKAPVTTLVVKDRALDHHPVQALREAPGEGAAR